MKKALFLERGVITVVAAIALLAFTHMAVFGATAETPKISAKAKFTLSPTYPAAFFYSTDDDVTIFDTVQLFNFDATRDATVQLIGKVENSEGWFAFASNSVDVSAGTIFSPQEETFSVTIPDGICEDEYFGQMQIVITDYDGKPSGSSLSVSATVAVDVVFDITSGVPCVGGETLPGLGAAPSYTPPDAITAELLEEGPVDDGGGGPPIILTPPDDPPTDDSEDDDPPEDDDAVLPAVPPEDEEEEEELVQITVKAHPEKRTPSVNNWATRGELKIYQPGQTDGTPDYNFVIPTDNTGFSTVEVDMVPGPYETSFKGLSHLSKFVSVLLFEEITDVDFTFGETFQLLAGDVHLSKDDFINALDLSATAVKMYQSDEHADLNADGIVNALDFSIEGINIYAEGETEPSDQARAFGNPDLF